MKQYTLDILKDLTQENLPIKVQNLITEIGTTNYVNSNQSELMFILYNTIFPDKQEHTATCDSCRMRVYHGLKDYLKTLEGK